MADSKTILQEVWRAANTRPNGMTIPCEDERAAVSLRFALYNAVKVFRTGRATPDNRLHDAMEECSISLTPDKKGIVVRKKSETGAMPDILRLLGKDEGEIKSAEVLAARESSERILRRMEETAPRHNPEPEQPTTKANAYGARNRKEL